MDNTNLKNLIQQEIQNYMSDSQYGVVQIPSHVHNGVDTPHITTLSLPVETPAQIGFCTINSSSNVFKHLVASGATNEQIQAILGSGKGQVGTIGAKGDGLQFNLLHQPQNASNQSFITANRPPNYGTPSGTTVSVTIGGNTVAITGWGFATNELANALINIYNSSGTFVESQTIASNTGTVITISGTWLATTNGGTFFIYQPVFFGSADTIYQRFYTQEGTGAGIRFGVGVTNGGQNGLLYSDATGDLYWRSKAGVSTKLN